MITLIVISWKIDISSTISIYLNLNAQDNFLPPSQRNNYDCEKESTGPLNRKKLIEHINKEALETPDRPEFEPFIKGKVRGKKWVPPPPDAAQLDADEKIAIDLGDEYEQALTDASQEEIIDLAGKRCRLFLMPFFMSSFEVLFPCALSMFWALHE